MTSVVLLSGAPATATAKTVTVSFTADGPSPSSVTISPGDTIVYRNDVDPQGGGLLNAVGGVIQSVTVTVTNAAQSPFDLRPGQSRSLTYTQPVATTYVGTYQPKLLGLLPGKAVTTTGKVSVKDSSTDSPPVVSPVAQPPSQDTGSGTSTGPGAGSSGQGAGQSNPSVPSDQSDQGAGQAPPQVNYTPRSGDAAAGQVPQGSGVGASARATSGTRDNGDDNGDAAPAGTNGSAGPGDDAGVSLPQIGSADQKQESANAMSRTASDSSASSLGLPAITAVVLLSMVSAGLVRTIMVRHAGHASLA